MVVQRVSRAAVRVDGRTVGCIGRGLLVLVGVERGDGEAQVARAAHRLASLRIFADEAGKMNVGIDAVGGEVLVVSQFTLAGSIKRGRRPDFFAAAPPEEAEPLIEELCDRLRGEGVRVATGVFRAHMEVELVNDGPVTLIWDDPPAADGAAQV
jgi:D-tyrosyl-tRNA(Tyr) deacylase